MRSCSANMANVSYTACREMAPICSRTASATSGAEMCGWVEMVRSTAIR